MSDEIVYLRDPITVAGNSLAHVAKNYIKGNFWIECHLTFEIQGSAHHMLVVIESQQVTVGLRHLRKVKAELVTVNRNPPVLVDVAQSIETPEQVRRWVRSVVRLKRLDEPLCACGHSSRTSIKRSSRIPVVSVQN